jgi:small subunit ribosomal protein S17
VTAESETTPVATAGQDAEAGGDPAQVAARDVRSGRSDEPSGRVPSSRPNRRKVREGIVVSDKMDKTAVVEVRERVRHPRYGKIVQRTKRLYAHDPANDVHVGDRVKVAETRPLSRLKRWRVVEVMERAR